MKTTEMPMVQEETNSQMSKPRRQGEVSGDIQHQPSTGRMSPIPIEWLDPDCWRLPSGKALAEFALQAGFLAPLMLGLPKPRRVQASQARADGARAENDSAATPEDGGHKMRQGSRPAPGAGKRV
jgi:hypothetical protein